MIDDQRLTLLDKLTQIFLKDVFRAIPRIWAGAIGYPVVWVDEYQIHMAGNLQSSMQPSVAGLFTGRMSGFSWERQAFFVVVGVSRENGAVTNSGDVSLPSGYQCLQYIV
jgi:hypothetical protein